MYWTESASEMTIGAALSGAVQRFGSRAGYKFDEEHRDLAEVQERSAIIARAMLSQGIRKGDKVAVFMANHAEWPEIFFAVMRIGAVLIALNTRWTSAELEYCLAKSNARLLLLKRERTTSGRDYADIINEILPELAQSSGGKIDAARAPGLETVIDIADPAMTGALPYREFVSSADAVTDAELMQAEAQVAPRDPALIQYTSGTTSFPKGALLHHAGMLRGGRESPTWLQLKDTDVLFSVQPFYHGGGTIVQMLAPLITGCVVVTQIYFDPGEALRLMEQERATALIGHQPHFIEYMNHPSFEQRDLKIERALVIAPPEIFWMVREKFGIDGLVSGYGMTETHNLGTATSLIEDPIEVRFNTNGRPVDGAELEIRDPNGEVLGPGEEGEIFLKVVYPMLGYLDMPEQTAQVLLSDGWYRTGDKGVLRPDGNLCLLGRVRDMIRVGGENLSGAEVDACLLMHPKVKQAAAIAAPDKRLGEVVIAFVELKDGAFADEAELVRHCRVHLAGFKIPRQIHFVREWPMSGSGKIQKHLLKAQPVDA